MQGTEQLHGGGAPIPEQSSFSGTEPVTLSAQRPPGASLHKQVENEWILRQGVCGKQHHAESFYIYKKKKKNSEMKITQSLKSSSANDASEPGANQWQDASLVPVLSKLYRHQLILPFWARLGLWIRSVSLTSSVTSSSLVRISHFYRSVLWRRPIQTSHF